MTYEFLFVVAIFRLISYLNSINIPSRSAQLLTNGRLGSICPFSSRGLAAVIVNTGPKEKLQGSFYALRIKHLFKMFSAVLPSLESFEFMKAVATSIGITMQVPKAAGKATPR